MTRTEPRRSPAEIARLEEARQALGTSEVAGESEPIAGGIMSYTAPGSWSNQAVGLGFEGPVSDAQLDRLVAFYRERGCDPQIELCGYAHPTLREGLAARGFVLTQFEHVLAREFDPDEDLRALHPYGWPQDLTIERVDPTDDEAVAEWVALSTCGFRPLDEPIPEHLFELSARLARHPRVVALTARLAGVGAGGGAAETYGDIGALFATSVHPDHRRRGVQLALMIERLELLRAAGADLVTIGSVPGIGTDSNARRLGFQVAYSKVVLVQPGP